MSTRGIVVFVGPNTQWNYGDGPKRQDGFRLYQHCDSYPTSALETIRDTLRRANRTVAKTGDRFDGKLPIVTPEMLAGFYLAENTSEYGMGSRLEEAVFNLSPLADLRVKDRGTDTPWGKLLGNQGDLEWIYVVDTEAKRVLVFGGGFTGLTGAEIVTRGTVDPMEYAERLIPEAQEDCRKTIRSLRRSLARMGWPVNPKAEG